MASPRTPTGQYEKGTSGNPRGRPPRARQDSVPTALVRTPSQPAPTPRRDGWQNEASGHGTRRDRRTLTRFGVDIVTDIEALQLWRSEFLAATIIEGEPKEALKRGWRFKCEDKDLEVAVLKRAEEIGLEHALRKAAEYENAYGGSAIFPVLTGALGDLSTELDPGAIASVDAFHVFEPQELLPNTYYKDIRLPKWRRPETYRLIPLTSGRSGYFNPQIVHESRLIIFPGTRVSVQTQPGQREGWGDSNLCRPRQVIADFGLSWASAATLLHEHGKGTLEMDNFANMMAQADGLDQFDKYITAMQMAWSTIGMVVIDGKSRYSRSTGALTGISEVLNEFKVLMAAAVGRPVSTLFGQSQTGLRTGDDDTLSWNAKVEGYQGKHLRPRHEQAVKLILLSTAGPTNGQEPEAWSVEYPPISTPSEKEKSEIQLADMQRAKIAIETGVASKDDCAESFYKGDSYSGDIKIDWERRKKEQAEAKLREAQAAAQAAGGAGAPPVAEQEDLSPEELADLQGLQEEFGTSDGQEPDDSEPDDEEPDFGDDVPDDEDLANDHEPRTDDLGAQGYNPYRTHGGQFGSGPHKARPGAGERQAAAVAKSTERVGKTGARVEHYAGKLAESHQARHAAIAETRGALEKAKAAGELARAKPTAKNLKAAEVATNKATRAQAKVGKHEAAIAKHTDLHAKAVGAHAKSTEAHAKTVAKGAEVKAAGKAKTEKPAAKPAVEAKPAAKPATAAPAKPVDPKAAHEAAARESVTKAQASLAAIKKEGVLAKDAVADTDFTKAKQHLANIDKHQNELSGHVAAAEASAKQHGGADLAGHVSKSLRDEDGRSAVEQGQRLHGHAEAEIRFGEGDQKLSYSRRAAPEQGALKAGEYRESAESFPKSLTLEQKVAVSNYTDHSDHILNPMLRQTKGQPDSSAKMYEGSQVPEHVHQERLGKRRERVGAERDTDMTVGTEMKHLDSAIASHSFDRDVTAYRVLKDDGGKIMGNLQVGSTFQDHGYVSTTSDSNFLKKFYSGDPQHRVDVHVTIKAGKPAAPIQELTSFKSEKEILLPRGSKFRVTKIVPATETAARQVHVETI
jgi:phage-related protein (TIGR01555 family)